jgi:endonuclease/exonuclease/phosphatase family metal-dependent hydrolase
MRAAFSAKWLFGDCGLLMGIKVMVTIPVWMFAQQMACARIFSQRVTMNDTGLRPHAFPQELLRSRNQGPTLKVMTYNIHSCVNIYGQIDPESIIAVIASTGAEVIALQEVESFQPGIVRGMNQAHFIAAHLGMHHRFLPLRNGRWGKFGLAIISRYPFQVIKSGNLPNADISRYEQRGALWVRFDTVHGPLHLINTHLGLYLRDRWHQIEALFGKAWIGGLTADQPLILCGDFNAGARSPIYRHTATRMRDVQLAVSQKGYPRATFFSYFPILRLDHIFVRNLTPLNVRVPVNPFTRRASDHLPLWSELAVSPVTTLS